MFKIWSLPAQAFHMPIHMLSKSNPMVSRELEVFIRNFSSKSFQLNSFRRSKTRQRSNKEQSETTIQKWDWSLFSNRMENGCLRWTLSIGQPSKVQKLPRKSVVCSANSKGVVVAFWATSKVAPAKQLFLCFWWKQRLSFLNYFKHTGCSSSFKSLLSWKNFQWKCLTA